MPLRNNWNDGEGFTHLDQNDVANAVNDKVDKATLTAKGDLYVATNSGTITRLPVGDAGQVLTADAAQQSGLRWSTPLNEQSVTAQLSQYLPTADSGATGRALLAAADQEAAQTAIGASAPGKAVLGAADAAAARAAIGAGTSSLQLGTSSSTAKAGNYAPAWPEITGTATQRRTAIGATAVGASVLEAVSQTAARIAIGPHKFYATNYGVVANGLPGNNVANMMDCLAACNAAGGGEIILPPGIIDMTGYNIGYVTANSGNVYNNLGALQLLYNKPICFTGAGKGATIIRFGPGFRRWADFRTQTGGLPPTWRNIVVKGITFDRNGLTNQTYGFGPETPINITAPTASGSGYSVMGVAIPQRFRNADAVYFPNTNTGTAKNVVTQCYYDTTTNQLMVNMRNWTFQPGDTFMGQLTDHVIIGNSWTYGMQGNGAGANISNVLVEDCEVINATMTIPDRIAGNPFGAIGTNGSSAVNIATYPYPTYVGSTSRLNNIIVRRTEMYGGNVGFALACNGLNDGTQSYGDNLWFIDCYHDTLQNSSTLYRASNYIFGANGTGGFGRVGLVNCTGKNSGDVAREVDQAWETYEINCLWENSKSGAYSVNFGAPAKNADGPPFALLAAAITSTTSTTATINALPSSVDMEGIVLVGSEQMAYRANAAGTTLTLWRGLNGTTAATHLINARVTFVESHKTRQTIEGSRSLSTKDWAGNTQQAGTQAWNFNGSGLPHGPVTMRDCIGLWDNPTMFSSGEQYGRFVQIYGWVWDLDMQNCRSDYGGAIIPSGSTCYQPMVSWDFPSGAALWTNGVPIRAPRLYGRNNAFRFHGVCADTNTFKAAAVRAYRGLLRLDFEAFGEITIVGGSAGSSRFFELAPSTGNLVIMPGSRLALRARASHPLGDPAPTVFAVASTSTVNIADTMDVAIDAADLRFTASAEDSNYTPWIVDASQVGKIYFNPTKHSRFATGSYPTYRKKTTLVTSSPYAVRPDDEILLVNSAAAAVTINLPSVLGGGITGQPLTRGRHLSIVDVGYNATVNNITVAPTVADCLKSGAAGVSSTIAVSGGAMNLVSYGQVGSVSGWADIGSGGGGSGGGSTTVSPGGPLNLQVVTLSSPTVLGSTANVMYKVLVQAGGAALLPSAVNAAWTYTIKNDSPVPITITPNVAGQTIDGYPSVTIDPKEARDIWSDNANWRMT